MTLFTERAIKTSYHNVAASVDAQRTTLDHSQIIALPLFISFILSVISDLLDTRENNLTTQITNLHLIQIKTALPTLHLMADPNHQLMLICSYYKYIQFKSLILTSAFAARRRSTQNPD